MGPESLAETTYHTTPKYADQVHRYACAMYVYWQCTLCLRSTGRIFRDEFEGRMLQCVALWKAKRLRHHQSLLPAAFTPSLTLAFSRSGHHALLTSAPPLLHTLHPLMLHLMAILSTKYILSYDRAYAVAEVNAAYTSWFVGRDTVTLWRHQRWLPWGHPSFWKRSPCPVAWRPSSTRTRHATCS